MLSEFYASITLINILAYNGYACSCSCYYSYSGSFVPVLAKLSACSAVRAPLDSLPDKQKAEHIEEKELPKAQQTPKLSRTLQSCSPPPLFHVLPPLQQTAT